MKEEENINEEVEHDSGYELDKFWKGSTDPSKTQKSFSYEKRKRRKHLEKEGRRNNRYSHQGKNATGRKNW